ncbi:hypothetical protein C8Q76DRAFT_699121 [Earliella scabrosa]|nr:hypothetical protein C8Q76DRAFT_699121 [Earliella scabrosa]
MAAHAKLVLFLEAGLSQVDSAMLHDHHISYPIPSGKRALYDRERQMPPRYERFTDEGVQSAGATVATQDPRISPRSCDAKITENGPVGPGSSDANHRKWASERPMLYPRKRPGPGRLDPSDHRKATSTPWFSRAGCPEILGGHQNIAAPGASFGERSGGAFHV